jgi:hypothetical protein
MTEEKIETKLYNKVYGPYKNSKGRLFVVVETKEGNNKTISYPKFLMEEHLGRILDPEQETVDHINGDMNDNRIENFRLIDRKTHSKQDTRRIKLIELTCDMCGEKFFRSPRVIRIQSSLGVRGMFCGKSCAGKYSRLRALNKIRKMPKVKPVKSEYYKLHDYNNEIKSNDL